MALPVLGLWLLVAQPDADARWEDHTTHLALTLTIALVAFGLGGRMNFEARRREDARLFLVSLAFSASAGFFALHALATPGVFYGRNGGFVLATQAGLLVASGFAAASAIELPPGLGAAVMDRRQWLRGGLALLLVAWFVATVANVPVLAHAITPAQARLPLRVPMVVGGGLFLVAAARFFLLHRRRPSAVLVSLITSFVLLGEASVAVAYSRSWQISWWEWHILLVLAYAFVAYAAVLQWRREGSTGGLFDAIALRQTVRDIRADYTAALEAVVAAIETGQPVGPAAGRLRERFELTDRQVDVIVRAAEALADERDTIRRQGALVQVGRDASVIRPEDELVERVLMVASATFGRDQVRILRTGDHPGEAPAAGDRLTLPLLVKGREAGAVAIVRPGAPFVDRDRAFYAAFASQVSIALENARLYHQIDALFRSYLSPDVATSLLADPTQAALGGAVQEVTILMADLRGFTPFAERTPPDEVVALLNAYFGAVVPIVLEEGGTIVQFVGDALMAMFNAPTRQPDHARRAARAALRGQAATATGPADRDGVPVPRFRMGINTGPALVGNIGSEDVRCYTAIGDTTNLAARLESVAPVGGVVISEATRQHLGAGAEVTPLGPLALKGKSAPVEAYLLESVADGAR